MIRAGQGSNLLKAYDVYISVDKRLLKKLPWLDEERNAAHQTRSKKTMQIKDKKALVTGAASALGLVFTRELLRNGAATVLMLDAQETAGELAAQKLNLEFGKNRALFMKCDVSRSSEFDGPYIQSFRVTRTIFFLSSMCNVFFAICFSRF